MNLENVEDPFRNRLSFGYHGMGDWLMSDNYWVKEHFSSVSKTFSPSSLNINNIHDLMEEATPSIYYMVCWLDEQFRNKECVYIPWGAKDVDPFFIPDDSIEFFVTLYFYQKFPEVNESSPYEGDFCKRKTILNLDLFKIDDLTKGGNILTKIKTRINEELKKKNSSDLTFVTDFVKIEINYVILHPSHIEEKMMEAYYKERDRYQ